MDNPEEIDLDEEEDDDATLDADAVPDDDPSGAAAEAADDPMFAPTEISTYSTADAAEAARAVAAREAVGDETAGQPDVTALPGKRRGLSAALAGLAPTVAVDESERQHAQGHNPEEIELPDADD